MEALENLMTKIQAFGLACYQHESGELQKAMQAEIRADLIAISAHPGTKAETVARPCRTDGRCQHAIDVDAEGMGSCHPRCIMPPELP